MDETMVSFSTPENKNKSKQWLPKGSPAPTKAKTVSSRKKQMVVTFFDMEGLVYQHYVPLGSSINAVYFVNVLRSFLKALKKKRPTMVQNRWILHMDNAPSHSAVLTKEFLATKNIRTIRHPPYSPDLAPADFFFFPKAKNELSGTHIMGSSVRTAWERVCGTIPKESYELAFKKWVDHWKRCEEKEGDYVEK